jgi:hypothetical protein
MAADDTPQGDLARALIGAEPVPRALDFAVGTVSETQIFHMAKVLAITGGFSAPARGARAGAGAGAGADGTARAKSARRAATKVGFGSAVPEPQPTAASTATKSAAGRDERTPRRQHPQTARTRRDQPPVRDELPKRAQTQGGRIHNHGRRGTAPRSAREPRDSRRDVTGRGYEHDDMDSYDDDDDDHDNGNDNGDGDGGGEDDGRYVGYHPGGGGHSAAPQMPHSARLPETAHQQRQRRDRDAAASGIAAGTSGKSPAAYGPDGRPRFRSKSQYGRVTGHHQHSNAQQQQQQQQQQQGHQGGQQNHSSNSGSSPHGAGARARGPDGDPLYTSHSGRMQTTAGSGLNSPSPQPPVSILRRPSEGSALVGSPDAFRLGPGGKGAAHQGPARGNGHHPDVVIAPRYTDGLDTIASGDTFTLPAAVAAPSSGTDGSGSARTPRRVKIADDPHHNHNHNHNHDHNHSHSHHHQQPSAAANSSHSPASSAGHNGHNGGGSSSSSSSSSRVSPINHGRRTVQLPDGGNGHAVGQPAAAPLKCPGSGRRSGRGAGGSVRFKDADDDSSATGSNGRGSVEETASSSVAGSRVGGGGGGGGGGGAFAEVPLSEFDDREVDAFSSMRTAPTSSSSITSPSPPPVARPASNTGVVARRHPGQAGVRLSPVGAAASSSPTPPASGSARGGRPSSPYTAGRYATATATAAAAADPGRGERSPATAAASPGSGSHARAGAGAGAEQRPATTANGHHHDDGGDGEYSDATESDDGHAHTLSRHDLYFASEHERSPSAGSGAGGRLRGNDGGGNRGGASARRDSSGSYRASRGDEFDGNDDDVRDDDRHGHAGVDDAPIEDIAGDRDDASVLNETGEFFHTLSVRGSIDGSLPRGDGEFQNAGTPAAPEDDDFVLGPGDEPSGGVNINKFNDDDDNLNNNQSTPHRSCNDTDDRSSSPPSFAHSQQSNDPAEESLQLSQKLDQLDAYGGLPVQSFAAAARRPYTPPLVPVADLAGKQLAQEQLRQEQQLLAQSPVVRAPGSGGGGGGGFTSPLSQQSPSRTQARHNAHADPLSPPPQQPPSASTHTSSGGSVHTDAEPATPGGGEEDEDLELMYDPVLNCYYDPRTNKYYELKT